MSETKMLKKINNVNIEKKKNYFLKKSKKVTLTFLIFLKSNAK